MTNPPDHDWKTLTNAAFRQAAVEVIRVAQRTNTPLIIWHEGRVQAVSPAEFLKSNPSFNMNAAHEESVGTELRSSEDQPGHDHGHC